MRWERGSSVRLRQLRFLAQAGACVAAGVLLVVLLFTNMLRTTVPRGRPPGIALRVSDHLGQVHIQWDLQSPAVLQCLAAYLAITDGPVPMLIELDQTMLRTGSVYYSPRSGRAVVKMALITPAGQSIEESVQFVASNAPARSVLPLASREPLPVAGLETPARISVQVPPGVQPVPLRRFRLPAPARPPALAERAQLEPPQLLVPPRADVRALPVLAAPRPSSVPVPVPAPAPAPVKEPPMAEAGQIIWTGKLERRGVVEIQGRQASVGYLSGTLPGAPAVVQVFPGELLPGGLRLYTANPALAHRSESAGPHNGWNATDYVWDPTRAMDISVLESPGRHNGWQHLVLRAESRSYAVIVIRWSALHPPRP
jgi:hypothetical protein